jgi:hypothetical protein
MKPVSHPSKYQSIVSAPAHLGLRKSRMPVVNPRIPQSEGSTAFSIDLDTCSYYYCRISAGELHVMIDAAMGQV